MRLSASSCRRAQCRGGSFGIPTTISTLTAQDIQMWLNQAQQHGLNHSIYQEGIAVLQQLLTALTPKDTGLLSNYPNPFNPETWIPYGLAAAASVQLCIYDRSGCAVRTSNLGHWRVAAYESRINAIYWNGRNDLGERVTSGVYFYTLSAGDYKWHSEDVDTEAARFDDGRSRGTAPATTMKARLFTLAFYFVTPHNSFDRFRHGGNGCHSQATERVSAICRVIKRVPTLRSI